ncbi:30S ribosomal protein S6 [Tepidanaerobacter acetatoxydans]|uniref:30S ribosomal protein S6 n=1 Tax=Tepidanaerobacter acetatoxydans TaxID=499229 RepID=UPI001BD3F93E|nr:30S ribosomal protein S6 [Tepidanaerobacter acetatoxydans]
MRQYETVFIIDPEFEADEVKALVEKFKGMIEDQGGEVTEVDEWGKFRLAYPINDKREGHYFLMNFTANPATAQDLERVYKITNGLMRYLIINKEK